MKKIAIAFILFWSHLVLAQAGIETTGVIESSAILRFPDGGNKGIVLPQVATPAGTAGSMLFDNTAKTVKYRSNSGWIDLTPVGVAATINATGVTESSAQTIIGATSTAAQGALVLESDNKALILPKVANPEAEMITPQPGTICFDTATKMIAVYDGEKWSYWK